MTWIFTEPLASLPTFHRHQFVRPLALVRGVFGVADEVDEDLQHLVLLGLDGRRFFKLAAHVNVVPGERGGIDLQRVLHQLDGGDGLHDAGHLGVTLLHGDDLFDVVNVLHKLFEFLQLGGLIARQMLRQRGDVAWKLFARANRW